MKTVETNDLTNRRTSIFPALSLLRISMGVVYLWFGSLKFFSGLSPAEELAKYSIHKLTMGLLNDHTSLFLLASLECLIGMLLITGKYVKGALLLLFPHMLCTFAPFVFSPQETFRVVPYGLTLAGQYIIKNIVIITAAVVIWQEGNENTARDTPKQDLDGEG
jgi:uncharacterized membrane protein YphA (DoxX/SURF4 family)